MAAFLRSYPLDRPSVLRWIAEYPGVRSSLIRRFAAVKHYAQFSSSPACDRIAMPSAPPIPKRPFTEDELRRILAACRRAQDRALILFALDTGVRRSELVNLRRQDIDLNANIVRVMGKGGKERLVALGERTAEALRLCLDGRSFPWYSQRTQGPLTPDGFYRLCRRLSKATGIHVHPHRFRTTWACQFLEATGGDVGSAQILMGHAKVEMTLRYASWTRERRALDIQRRHSLADRVAG